MSAAGFSFMRLSICVVTFYIRWMSINESTCMHRVTTRKLNIITIQ
jgi:hypothetical protein